MDTLAHVEDVIAIEQLLRRARLDERQIRALHLRYGFEGPALTLREVGEELGISHERARQIVAKAFRRIRQRNALPGWNNYYGRLWENGRWVDDHWVPPPKPQEPHQRKPPEPPKQWGQILPAGMFALDCDTCSRQFVSSSLHHPGNRVELDKVAELRRGAAKNGWLIGVQDLCPACCRHFGLDAASEELIPPAQTAQTPQKIPQIAQGS
jgi:hypothetical protein